MIDLPVTRFAERDGISLAYQVFGDGDFDLLFVPGGVSHVDLAYRRYSRFMQRLGSFARVTVFDKQGMGAPPIARTRPTASSAGDPRGGRSSRRRRGRGVRRSPR